ncbi:MAG TPA: cellulose binding domain-containing protein, partial [Polyangiaceae bacterium]
VGNGPDTAIAPSVTVNLPPHATFTSCTSAGGSCAATGTSALLQVAGLPAGASVTFQLGVSVDCLWAPGSTLSVTGKLTTLSSDPVPMNDAFTLATSVVASPPIFTLVPGDVTISKCTGVTLQPPTATDGCGSASLTFTNNAPAKFPLGNTVVTWTATNGSGATATATQLVTAVLGNDSSCCPTGSNVMTGTSNNDNMTGTSGADCILGLGAQDTINGGGGNDVISGGEGNDIINGGEGDDRLYGGSGQDTLNGGNGNDFVDGSFGEDVCHGNAGNDSVLGGQGQDQLFGDDGADKLFGGVGYDVLSGGLGNDYLEGGGPNDQCTGGVGSNAFVSCATKTDAPTAPDACSDSVLDGNETAIDCGGSGCKGCAAGAICTAGSDCASQVCTGGTCTTPVGPVSASLTVTADWGTGYCATVNATNVGATATTTWSVVFTTGPAVIYSSFEGTFTASSGTVSVTPTAASNGTILPGATNSAVNFCANRSTGTSGLPSVIAATGG